MTKSVNVLTSLRFSVYFFFAYFIYINIYGHIYLECDKKLGRYATLT